MEEILAEDFFGRIVTYQSIKKSKLVVKSWESGWRLGGGCVVEALKPSHSQFSLTRVLKVW